MEHLENITKFIESSTYPVLGEQLQNLLMKKHDEFLAQEIKVKLNEVLIPYLRELKQDLTFNVTLKGEGEIIVDLPDLDIDHECSDGDELDDYDDSDSFASDDFDADDDIYLSDAVYIDNEFKNKGIVPIKPIYYTIIETILGIPIRKIFDVPVDVEFDDRIYEDATMCCFDEGANLCKDTNYYVILKWPHASALGRDIKAMSSSRLLSYKYYTISYNKSNSCFKINLFKDDPYRLP